MKCPYCNKEISDTSVFCPECGQSVSREQSSSTSENYWNTVASDDKKRNQEYLKTLSRQKSEQNSQRIKKLAVIVSVLALVVVALGYVFK